MRKATIKSLTRKGYSQYKIAKTLGIRKMKVVTAQKALKIGKRVKQPFWDDVRHERELYGLSWSKSKTKVKYAEKWYKKRQARLKGIAKAKDMYGKTWQQIKEGEIPDSFFETEEGEELMESAQYG